MNNKFEKFMNRLIIYMLTLGGLLIFLLDRPLWMNLVGLAMLIIGLVKAYKTQKQERNGGYDAD